MSDYFTHFSCEFDVGSAGNAARAIALYRDAPEDEDGSDLSEGFDLALTEEGSSKLWIHDGYGGDLEKVIAFVLLCAAQFDLHGLWGFEYANSCSKPRLDAFGGGAHVLDLGTRKTLGWTSTNEWLVRALDGEDPDA